MTAPRHAGAGSRTSTAPAAGPAMTALFDVLQDLSSFAATRPLLEELRGVREELDRSEAGVSIVMPVDAGPDMFDRVAADFDCEPVAIRTSPFISAAYPGWRMTLQPAGDWQGRSAFAVGPWLYVVYADLDDINRVPGVIDQAHREAALLLLRGRSSDALAFQANGGAVVRDCSDWDAERFATLLRALGTSTLREHVRERGRVYVADALADVLETQVGRESRGLKLKSGQLRQRLSALQQRGASRDLDSLVQVKSLLKRQLGDLERGIRERIDELTAPHIGSLWQALRGTVDALPALEQTPQSRSIALSVPDGFLRQLLGQMQRALADAGGRDVSALRDQLLLVEQELEELSNAQGLPALVIDAPPPPNDRLSRLVTQAVRIERPYAGQMSRSGVLELFMSARRFMYPLLFLLPLLGSIVVLLGITENARDLRNKPEFAVATVVFLVIAGVLVSRADRAERAEKLAAELGKAKQSLATEVDRVLAAYNQGWVSTVAEWLRSVEQRIVQAAESTLREHAQRGAQNASDERHRLQLQVQTLESNERRLAAATKSREAALTALQQVRGTVASHLSLAIEEALSTCAPEST